MAVIGYARCKDEKDATMAQVAMENWTAGERQELRHFNYDIVGGQRGLKAALRVPQAGETLLVRYLSDLSRDLSGLLRTAQKLIRRDVAIAVLENDLRCGPGTETAKLVESIKGAQAHYWRQSIRLGMLAAKQAGTHVGRPRKAKTAPDRVKSADGAIRGVDTQTEAKTLPRPL